MTLNSLGECLKGLPRNSPARNIRWLTRPCACSPNLYWLATPHNWLLFGSKKPPNAPDYLANWVQRGKTYVVTFALDNYCKRKGSN